MASPSNSKSDWYAENVSQYRLRKDDLVQWLKAKFPKHGESDFGVKVSLNTFKVKG